MRTKRFQCLFAIKEKIERDAACDRGNPLTKVVLGLDKDALAKCATFVAQ